ncbi:fibronectin type III domain-containing protein [Poseidonibacter sp. 1_MG-2023]|uniref:fibronectin type III domain-containing protein n=1 Tax=Poseidonibacter TaxID=2321187 RepID=UPI001E3C8CE9|nr:MULTISPECIES: fibronectin type III domain-containing protein [Poseidonibacter]MDO6828401.1 fibronectin type III domain-containing protein [Poseidonibacter sp. 1_MG-2023]
MTKLMQTTSLTALLLLLSGCNNLNNNLNAPVKPKIDETIEVIDNSSLKSISDMTSIAFEWKKVDDVRVTGYNFYRANMHKDGRRLKLIESVNNKYTTHFVDKELEPDTKYVYQISSKTADDTESNTTDAYITQTLPRIVPVSFVQALSDLPNRIKIIWRPHPDLRVAYYKIEKFNTTLNEWNTEKKIKGRLESEYIDDGLDNNETFKYRVTAYTFEDVSTKPSEAVTAKTKALPNGVQNLSATNNEPKKIILSWEPSVTNDIIKYEIHRSAIKTFGFKRIKEVNNSTFAFVDQIDEDGKEYYYKVVAVDKDNLKSSSKTDPIKGISLNQPAKPTITLAQIQNSQAILNWTSPDNRAISYNIYKKTMISFFESKTEKFTNIRDLRFVDNNIISGVEYKYSIQANDTYGLMSEKTDEASLILPKIPLKK